MVWTALAAATFSGHICGSSSITMSSAKISHKISFRTIHEAHHAFFNYDILFPEFIIPSSKPTADWNRLEALILGTEFSFFKSQQISSLKKQQ